MLNLKLIQQFQNTSETHISVPYQTRAAKTYDKSQLYIKINISLKPDRTVIPHGLTPSE